MNLYLDESGDLGWTLDKPNRFGGSSKYITITGILISESDEKYISRFISHIYKKYRLTPKIEKKGANFIPDHSRFISSQLNKVINKSESFRIISITVSKENVNEALRRDKNIFYNYVLGLLIKGHVIECESIKIVIDKRTIKVSHGQSFPDYIKTQIWGEGHNIDIDCEFVESDTNKMIWFADWFANFVWRYYEDGESSSYELLVKKPASSIFLEKKLFFKY